MGDLGLRVVKTVIDAAGRLPTLVVGFRICFKKSVRWRVAMITAGSGAMVGSCPIRPRRMIAADLVVKKTRRDGQAVFG